MMKIGPMRLFAALGITAVVAAALFALMFRVGGEEKALLFSDVDMAEAGEIASKLDGAKIAYELRGDGTAIFVPRSQVMSARLMLSEDGLPSRGSIGYEIFDKQDALGATQFQQNINRLRALEGELARTIASIDGVERARVHLVLPERQLFSQDKQAPSASIVLTVKGGQLSQGQVRAVRNLVASAVPGLSVNRVTIADASGKLLAAAEDDSGAAAADAMDERKVAVEERLRKEVQDIVESVVGPGAARVQIAADIDFNRVTSTSQTFDPEGRVVRETNSTEETSASSDGAGGGGASATRNLPDGAGASGGSASASGSNTERTEEQVRYEISNTTKTEIVEGGRIKRLSVAVAVDGVTAPGADGKPGEWAARDPQELDRITTLVKSAVGFDEARGDKVEVVNLKFAQAAAVAGTEAAKPSMFDFGKDEIMRGVELFALLIVALGIIFFVLRPLIVGMLSGQGGGAPGGLLAGPGGGLVGAGGGGSVAIAPPVAGALPAPAGGGGGTIIDQQLDIAKIQGQVNSSSVKRVAEVIEQNPDESAQILRTWLSERA
ncbi:MAG: flagellar M-ring protein FliF [Hyphomonadaceae bacterium]|nr:flagellar M-ring protein FliF [Hyphomonadaceae bacterium]